MHLTFEQAIKQYKQPSTGGKADGKHPSDFDIEQLKKGWKVEREHSADPNVRIKTAMDHLTEDPKYYTKLLKYVEDKVLELKKMFFEDKLEEVDSWVDFETEVSFSLGMDDEDLKRFVDFEPDGYDLPSRKIKLKWRAKPYFSSSYISSFDIDIPKQTHKVGVDIFGKNDEEKSVLVDVVIDKLRAQTDDVKFKIRNLGPKENGFNIDLTLMPVEIDQDFEGVGSVWFT